MNVLSWCRSLASRAKTVEGRQALVRQELRSQYYSGVVHIATTIACALGPGLAAWLLVDSWGAAEAVTLVVGALVAHTIIYSLHRGPMHHRLPVLSPLFDVHTRAHHMLFNEGEIEIRTVQDVDLVMLPTPWAVALCALGIPLLAAPLLLVSTDVALAFAGLAYFFFLAYELVHLAGHAPADAWVHRAPVLRTLVRHHQRHHAWERMHECNFSMIIPLWDWLLGTKE